MANQSLTHSSPNPQARQFLVCQSCGQGVLLAPAGATERTRYTCRHCTPRPKSSLAFDSPSDDAAICRLTRRYELDRDSEAGTDSMG